MSVISTLSKNINAPVNYLCNMKWATLNELILSYKLSCSNGQ